VTRSGYSIGIAFPPSWDEGYIVSLKQGESTILQEGMTFHIIPWMWGVDGDKTCGTSDTIYITSEGCESFFSMDQNFSVKPEHGAGSVAQLSSSRKSKSASKNEKDKSADKPHSAAPDDAQHDSQ
jgi:Xaa-Pro dipeptidase